MSRAVVVALARLAALAALVAGCAPTAPGGFGVNLTVDAHALAAADLQRIVKLRVTVSEDEQFATTIDVSKIIGSREVRAHYVPRAGARSLGFLVEALAGDDTLVARGQSPTVALIPGQAVPAQVVLTPASGVPDDGDMAVPLDLQAPEPPDMTTPPPDLACASCDDNDPCTADSCSGGACKHDPLDGTSCPSGTCHQGACCTGCWDGTACQSGGDVSHCGSSGGACQTCANGNPCRADKCSAGACSSDPLSGGACPTGVCVSGTCECGHPGEPCCTSGDACQSGQACQGTPPTCGNCGAAGQVCCSGSTCSAGNVCGAGGCQACGGVGQPCCSGQQCGAGAICNGSNTCQACGGAGQTCCTVGNACQSNLTCGAGNTCQCGGVGQPCCNGSGCTDDGNACDGTEACGGGVCGHTNPVVCTPVDVCHDAGTCNPSTGQCSTGAPKTGNTCNDNDSCTTNDTCASGVCKGTPLVCASGQRCITGSCICDATSCGSGCCAANQCVGGTSSSQCGKGGATCMSCSSSQVCQAQSCQGCGGIGQACCTTGTPCGNFTSCVSSVGSQTCQTCVAHVSVGPVDGCVLKASGKVDCWGSNDQGQLGVATSSMASSAVPVNVPNVSSVAQVAAGGSAVCVRNTGGAISCWGAAYANGATSASTTPNSISLGPAYSAIDLSVMSTGCAVGHATVSGQTDGVVYCWGDNSYGQCGNTTATQEAYASQISGISGASHVTTGYGFACALASGSVYCWGDDQSWQLGVDPSTLTNKRSSAPVKVPGLSGVDQLAAGPTSACARIGDKLYCWGQNSSGILGLGTTGNSGMGPSLSHPVLNAGGTTLTGVVDVSVGMFRACARISDGTVACWGTLSTNATSAPTATTVTTSAGGPALTGVVEIRARASCTSDSRSPPTRPAAGATTAASGAGAATSVTAAPTPSSRIIRR